MSANDTQIGGDHYKGAKCPECGTSIEHWDLAWLFKWDNFQYAINKYVMRWRSKHGIEDLRKAQHCLEKYIEVVTRDEAPQLAEIFHDAEEELETREPHGTRLTKGADGEWRTPVPCPRCGLIETESSDARYRSDGEKVLVFTCPRCKAWTERSEGEAASEWFEAMPTPTHIRTTKEGYEILEGEERANFFADAYDAANWGDEGAEQIGSLELRAFDNDGNEYTLMKVPHFGIRRDTFERPSPDLDESGEPGPGYVNQDPDLPLPPTYLRRGRREGDPGR